MNGVEGLKVLYGIFKEIADVVYTQSFIETKLIELIDKSKELKLSSDIAVTLKLNDAFDDFMTTMNNRKEVEKKIKDLQTKLDHHKKEVQAIEKSVLKTNRVGGLQVEHFDRHVFDAIESATLQLELFNQRTVLLEQGINQYNHFADQVNIALKSSN